MALAVQTDVTRLESVQEMLEAAVELWEYGISVNELVPGPVMTERARRVYGRRESMVFDIDSEWVKEPQDVAPLALFLATQPERGPTAQSFSLMRRDG